MLFSLYMTQAEAINIRSSQWPLTTNKGKWIPNRANIPFSCKLHMCCVSDGGCHQLKRLARWWGLHPPSGNCDKITLPVLFCNPKSHHASQSRGKWSEWCLLCNDTVLFSPVVNNNPAQGCSQCCTWIFLIVSLIHLAWHCVHVSKLRTKSRSH